MTGFQSARLAGVLCGLAAFLPFLGRLGPVPGRVAAFALFTTAVAFHLGTRLVARWPSRHERILLALAAVFAVLVIRAADPGQLAAIFDPMRALPVSRDYAQTKLIAFLISYIPPVVILALFLTLRPTWRADWLSGAALALAVIALFALLRLVPHADRLFSQDFMTARNFYMEVQKPFSTTSFSVLFGCVAVILAMSAIVVGSWYSVLFSISAGAACFLIVLLNQRADTLATVIAIGLCLFAARRMARPHKLVNVGAFVGCSFLALSALFANAENRLYWNALLNEAARSETLRTRVALALAFATSKPQAEPTVKGSPPEKRPALSEPQTELTDKGSLPEKQLVLPPWLVGRGIGTFADPVSMHSYPHNIIIEAQYEIGLVGAVALLALLGFAWGLLWRGAMVGRDTAVVALMGAGIVMTLHSMKAGDITQVGSIVLIIGVGVALAKPALENRP